MKNNLLKRFLFIISLMTFITIILTTNTNAYENISVEEQEADSVSLTTFNLSTDEETTFQVSSQDIGTILEEWEKNNTNSRAIIGTSDERTLITNTTSYPYSAIGFLNSIGSDNTSYYGTAFMVAPNVALTAAHCVYDSNNLRMRRFEFSPARNGNIYPFGTATTVGTGSTVTIPSDYLTNPNAGNDWALIKFINNIGDDCSWLNLQVGGYTYGSQGETFYVSGYPVHDPNDPKYIPFRTEFLDNHAIGYQFRDAGIILAMSTRHFTHTIDTLPGQSGSPVYFYDANNQVKVIGIHNRSGEFTYQNGQTIYSGNLAAKVNYTIVNAIAAMTE